MKLKLDLHDTRRIALLVFLFLSTGCAKLEHLQELLTLKDLSDDRDQQEIYMKNREKSFKILAAALKDNSIERFQNKKAFLTNFGKPLVIRSVVLNQQSLERWLYRYPTRAFGSPKVYLYFDKSGKLQFWQYFPRDEESPAILSQNKTLFP